MKMWTVAAIFSSILILHGCRSIVVDSPISPKDICLLTDHEPIPLGTCSQLARRISKSHGHHSRDIIDAISLGDSTIRESMTVYNHLIPCLNRQYACEQGYSFFMPSSPNLNIVQANVMVPGLFETLGELSGLCADLNIGLPKVRSLRMNVKVENHLRSIFFVC
jgi:hypothetical protein